MTSLGLSWSEAVWKSCDCTTTSGSAGTRTGIKRSTHLALAAPANTGSRGAQAGFQTRVGWRIAFRTKNTPRW